MTDLRKAAEMALKALEAHADIGIKSDKAVEALRQALAQPVDAVNISQERVDETDKFNHITVVCHKDHDKGYEDFQGKCLLCVVDELMLEIGSLMIQKQRAERREWVGLTEDEKYDVLEGATGDGGRVYYDTLFRSYEAKLKEKNT